MSGSTHKALYDQFIALVPDPRFTFMNHGYLGENDTFDWLKDEDVKQKYSTNLVRFCLEGIDLKDKNMLEIGCGRGGNCSYAARYTNLGRIVGLDFCKASIDFCKKVHQFDNLFFQHGDAQELPFDDEQFDVIINIESSHSYPDLKRFIQEVYRVLKKDGTFCYADVVFSEELQNQLQISDDSFEHVGLLFKKRNEKHERIIKDSGFFITDFTDITKQVIFSLEQEEGNLQSFLKEMIDKNLNNEEFIKTIAEAIERDILDAYREGEISYKYWRSRKSNETDAVLNSQRGIL